LIFRDAGEDAGAVEWLREAGAEHERMPSPNLETISEDLKNEIAALQRLGRIEEMESAQGKLATVLGAMNAIPRLDHGLATSRVPTDAAVLVELNVGGWTQNYQGKRDSSRLAQRLSEMVETQDAGFYAGKVVIAESTTLMFYGTDAESLFRTLEPGLKSEAMCAGGRVTIRQGDVHREVMLPGQVM
jgi:hypothetical protein